MRRTITLLTAGLLLAVMAVVALAVDTKPAANCERRLEALAEAKVETENIPDGVVITITAARPEAVALIQEFWQDCGMHRLLGHECACKDGKGDHDGGCGCSGCGAEGSGEVKHGCGGAGKACGRH